VRVALLDRGTEAAQLPRAVGLDGESVRAFQRIGHAQDVTAILQPPREPNRVCFTNSKREPLFGLDIPGFGPMGWPDVSFFDQPELEVLIRELVAREKNIALHLAHEVTGLEQDEEQVIVRSRAEGRDVAHRAAYAIGCDGASSFVREQVGIAWHSLGYDQDWLVIDIVVGEDSGLPLETMQVCDPERLTTYVCVRDPNRRWEFQLLPGETREEMVRPDRIESLLRDWIAAERYELRRAAVYQFHAATAERWQEGRILLAGDAAHQTPPFLGQGLNAGFRDAVNLGWKLPLVLDGTCAPALLESYAAERDAHARDLVDWAVAVGKLMETLAAREAGRPDPHPTVDQSAGYGQGRSAPPLRGGVLVVEQIAAGLPVGELLRQPRMRDAEGRRFLLDERLGTGFAVVARKASDLALGREAAAVFERIGGRLVSFDDVETDEGEMDRMFDSHPACVLRPDRYVFGVVDDDWTLDRLVLELGAKLHLTPG
jgi:2-polyprenyl-6-methoxyphenol hydroxylase-like FAD-dependent oxidoreductase